MRLTPLDIQHKTFPLQLRGYHRRQVHQFLEEVAETVEGLIRENHALREKLATKEEELGELRKAEAALTSTLVTTQTFTEQLKRGAQHDADLILKEAELKAEETLAQSRTQLTELQRSISDLRRQRVILLEQIRSTLKTFERIVEIEQGDAPVADEPAPVESTSDSSRLSSY